MDYTDIIKWGEAAGVRAVKTAAQAAIAAIGTAAAMGDVDWFMIGSTAALAAIVSILTSLAGLPEVNDGASIASLTRSGIEKAASSRVNDATIERVDADTQVRSIDTSDFDD